MRKKKRDKGRKRKDTKNEYKERISIGNEAKTNTRGKKRENKTE